MIGIDVDADLLTVARSSVEPRPGQQVAFVQVRGEDFVPPVGWTADLVTICRTFHWLDRRLVLERLAQIVAADGVVAILGDNSIWADNAGWKSEIKTILTEFLGEGRRAGSGTYQRPAPYTDDLEVSAFSDWQQLKVPVRRERNLDSVIGYLHSTSFAAPHLFGDRLEEFDNALRERLPRLAENSMFVDHNEFGILIGRRPGLSLWLNTPSEPTALIQQGVVLHCAVEDVSAAADRAREAGAEILREPTRMDFGLESALARVEGGPIVDLTRPLPD